MEETYQLIEGSPTLRDLDAENGFLWCPFGHSGRQNEPGILISRLDDGSYDVRLGTGFDSPERFATGDPDWSWMDLSVASTVDATFADDMALSDWIASETAAARPLHVSPAAISQAVLYGSPVNGLHFYHGDEPKPAPEFFKPAKVKGGKSPAAMAAAAKATAGNSAPGTDYREHGIQRDRRAVQ